MCSYWDKNIEPIFSEKLKNMKKCLNLQNLRTGEPQKKLLVLIKKKCVVKPRARKQMRSSFFANLFIL